MSEFGAASTADEVLAEIDLRGKTVFITGGASGLGQETARAMAARGAHIVIAARDEAKLAAAKDVIIEGSGSASVETILCDLGSLASVRACGNEARERFSKIDLLINNAGVMACPKGETSDGFEMQFGTNHLGHFVLTNELLPLVEQGTEPRIVNLSSLAHQRSDVHFDDLNYASREYEKWESYGQSKTANVLHAVALQKRLSDKDIEAFAVHPGGIITNLGRHLTEDDIAEMRARMDERGSGEFKFKTVEQGAATSCWAATAPDISGQGGVYCEDCHIAEVDIAREDGGVRPYALDGDAAEKLWAVSEEMVA